MTATPKAPPCGVRRIETRNGHRYTVDGVATPGVTSILSDGIPKPALLGWGIRSVAEYAADHLDRLVEMQPMGRAAIVAALKQAPYTDRDTAAKRGSEVHALAEKLIHDEEVDVPDELAGHVESYVRFLDDFRPVPVLVEVVVANRSAGYVGTLDLIADVPGHGRVLADIKTTRSGIYGETALQLAAYRHAEVYVAADGTEQPMPEVDAVWAIHVTGSGYKVHPLTAGPDQFRYFRHVATVARQVKSLRELVGAPITPEGTA